MRIIEHAIWYGDEEKAKKIASRLVDVFAAAAFVTDFVDHEAIQIDDFKALTDAVDAVMEEVG